MRFIKQRDTYGCGPVTVINALRWAGEKTPYNRYYEDLCKLCKTSPNGCSERAFDWVLREMGDEYYSTRRVTRPTLKQVETHLRTGGIVVMNTRVKKTRLKNGPRGGWKWNEQRHLYILADVSDSGRIFEVIGKNPEGPVSQFLFRWQLQEKEFRQGKTDKSFKGWFLTKREK